ncbi:MAG: DUF1343 domain-containing protein [Cyclobacteriaceae bacterium]
MVYKCFFALIFLSGCALANQEDSDQQSALILPGAYQLEEYLPDLRNKNVAVTVNHSSLIESTHLVDTLLSLEVRLTKVFTPEHGFTGTVSDGVVIEYEENDKPYELISLYGKNKKPNVDQLANIDVMLFDIQDVGVRFYTYISTMHYVMEACAQQGIPVIILDRPNPNASYVDGPVLDTAFSSFVGMHPIPVVHGMTIGEYAKMINGEGWLANSIACEIRVVKNKNWNHKRKYPIPVKPSPNLPNDLSISLYPSLCFFEGTIMSVGRGTDYPFQQIGHPDYPDSSYQFTPVSMEGAKWPPLEDVKCNGLSFVSQAPIYELNLSLLLEAYEKMNRSDFFNNYFKTLSGTDELQKQIVAGMSEQDIRQSWADGLTEFKKMRESYLLYD